MIKRFLLENTKKAKGKKPFLFIILGVIGVLIFIYLLISLYYRSHFYKNTIINGVNVGNMTASHGKETINTQIKLYTLTLNGRNDQSEFITGNDINLYAVFDEELSDILEKQTGFAWPIFLIKGNELNVKTIFRYDESLLEKKFLKLACLKDKNNREPSNAYISDYGVNGYEIISEELGTKVKKDNLYEQIKKSIPLLEPTLSLEEAGVYEEPKIDSTYPKLAETVEKLNYITGTRITYKFGEDIEVLDGYRISEWISVDKDYQITLDPEGVREYVDYIGKTYNSFGRVRTFQTSYDKVIQVSGGDYGWWLDRVKEVSDLIELIWNGQQIVRKPAYFQTASQYGKDDIGDTYVEVNLTAQHLFFYKDGELIVESDFVSGNLARDYGTPTGTFPVQYKEREATLNGENYSTPVSYWMPFNGNIGFHDAPWRKEFGKDIYEKKGSHGCINMPPVAAEQMFQHIERGVAVVVYELENTENYEVENDKRNKKNKVR